MTEVPRRLLEEVERRVAAADAERAARYPGDPLGRQPVHSVYVPADAFDGGTPAAWGAAAAAALADAGGVAHLLAVHDLIHDPVERERIGALVLAKLAREPIEDLRIDLEDGFGTVPDDVEDAAVDRAVAAVSTLAGTGALPPFVGIRFKCLEPATRERGLRTLWRFVTALAAHGPLPAGLRLTLPKVTSVAQVEAVVAVLVELERTVAAGGSLALELQVETPQAVLGPDGRSPLPAMIAAGRGRVVGVPYGTYDYSASLGIAAAEQRADHPVADHAKAVMQVAAAGTGAQVSDGSTNVLPVGERAEVDAAWALHGALVTRALRRGLYQGWDLHPAQLPSRYAATYAFFRSGLPALTDRLRDYLEGRSTALLDEPATARAMAAFLRRALHCGAVAADEVPFEPERLEQLISSGAVTP